jgi:hypothetical protein
MANSGKTSDLQLTNIIHFVISRADAWLIMQKTTREYVCLMRLLPAYFFPTFSLTIIGTSECAPPSVENMVIDKVSSYEWAGNISHSVPDHFIQKNHTKVHRRATETYISHRPIQHLAPQGAS